MLLPKNSTTRVCVFCYHEGLVQDSTPQSNGPWHSTTWCDFWRFNSKRMFTRALSFPSISLSIYRTAGMGGFHSHPCSERCWVTDNKGLGYLTPLLDANLTLVRKLFDTKFWSVLAMIKAFSPLIIAAKVKSSTLGQLRVSWRKPIGVYFTAVVVFMMIESF